MLAGYKPQRKYHVPAMKRMLLTMLTLWLMIGHATVLLYAVRFIIDVPSWYNVFLLINFVMMFITFTVVINWRNRHRIYLDR